MPLCVGPSAAGIIPSGVQKTRSRPGVFTSRNHAGLTGDSPLLRHSRMGSSRRSLMGFNGYDLMRMTDTHVAGCDDPDMREQVFAVGPGIHFSFPVMSICSLEWPPEAVPRETALTPDRFTTLDSSPYGERPGLYSQGSHESPFTHDSLLSRYQTSYQTPSTDPADLVHSRRSLRQGPSKTIPSGGTGVSTPAVTVNSGEEY